jgi:hypothetical protein
MYIHPDYNQYLEVQVQKVQMYLVKKIKKNKNKILGYMHKLCKFAII